MRRNNLRGLARRIPLIFLFLFLPPIVLGTATYPLIIVEGNSMTPALLNGDLVIYRGIDPDQITNGSIIVYMPGQTGIPALDYLVRPAVVHRVVEEIVQSDGLVYYRTQGDNNKFNDPVLVRSDQVLGTPVAEVPLVGLFVLFLKSPQGLVFMVAAVVFIYLGKYEKDRQNEQGKKELLAIMARMALNGELSLSKFEEFKLAIEFGEELPSQWLTNPVHASLADWIKSGGLSADWKEEPSKCPHCLQAATMIRGTKAYLVLCPRCSAKGEPLSPFSTDSSVPFVKESKNKGVVKGVSALVLALERLVKRRNRPT